MEKKQLVRVQEPPFFPLYLLPLMDIWQSSRDDWISRSCWILESWNKYVRTHRLTCNPYFDTLPLG